MKNRDVVQRPPAFRLKLQLRSKPFCFIVHARGTCLYDTLRSAETVWTKHNHNSNNKAFSSIDSRYTIASGSKYIHINNHHKIKILIMEENQAFAGKDDTIQVKSPNGNCSELNDPLLAESDNLNIATMSDFQFNESLDALVDISFTENLTTAPQTSPDIPSCFGVDETALTRTNAAPEPPAPQQPVTVHDNSYGSFSVNTSSSNNLVQQQSAPASNSFFPNVTATPLMMPFDPQAFLATGATQNNNFAPTSFMPPLSLQNSIEAFGQSISSQNFNHVYPVASMPSFMCVPPTNHQLSTSFST